MSSEGGRRSSRLANLLVVAGWIAAAVIANVVFSLLPARAGDAGSELLPQDARTSAVTSRIDEEFPGTGTNAIAYLVLESPDQLGQTDQRYFDALVAALRSDTHVGSVLDLWSDPLTAPLGTTNGGRSGIAVVWLAGEAGSAQARQSLDVARSVVRKVPLTPRLHARIAVPETTGRVPFHLNAWQAAAIVAAAAVIAALVFLRARLSAIFVGIALLTAGVSLALTWPLAAMLQRQGNVPVFTVFSETLGAVLVIGTIAASTMLVAHRRPDTGDSATDSARRRYRRNLPALALPGACVAALTGPLLLARSPALHSVGGAALGVVVALAASLTLLPAVIGLAGQRSEPPDQSSPTAGVATPTTRQRITRLAAVTAVVLAICALPVVGMRLGLDESPANPPGANRAQVSAGNGLPDVVVVESAHDLRDPSALIAIDQVSHRLMEVPGVRMVQSAAWPAGIPWPDASLTTALGKLSEQMGQGTAGPVLQQITAIKSLAHMLDQASSAVNELDKTMTAGLAAAKEIESYTDLVMSRARVVKEVTVGMTSYLDQVRDQVRDWRGGPANCPADMICSGVDQAVNSVDAVVADMVVLSNGADHVVAVSKSMMAGLDSAPRMLAQMKSSLAQLQTFVPNLEKTIDNALPQVAQMAAQLKAISNDFQDTGEGGFYLSRKAMADPSYRHVRQSLFSQDGTATRLFVYSDGSKLDLDTAGRVQQLEIAAGKAMKYGSLVDSKLTVLGAAQVASAVDGAFTHDALLVAVVLLAVLALVGVWLGAAGAAAVGLGVLASYLAALGISTALWQNLLGHDVYASMPLVSAAILAACGVPYLAAAFKAPLRAGETPAGAVPVRPAVAPLVAVGATLGGALVLISIPGSSHVTLGQVGTVLVIGLGAMIAVAHLCIPARPGGTGHRYATSAAPAASSDEGR